MSEFLKIKNDLIRKSEIIGVTISEEDISIEYSPDSFARVYVVQIDMMPLVTGKTLVYTFRFDTAVKQLDAMKKIEKQLGF